LFQKEKWDKQEKKKVISARGNISCFENKMSENLEKETKHSLPTCTRAFAGSKYTRVPSLVSDANKLYLCWIFSTGFRNALGKRERVQNTAIASNRRECCTERNRAFYILWNEKFKKSLDSRHAQIVGVWQSFEDVGHLVVCWMESIATPGHDGPGRIAGQLLLGLHGVVLVLFASSTVCPDRSHFLCWAISSIF
jgi:hypothetical protein